MRKALIEAGYDMASSQAERMEEDRESWREDIIEDKINPKCIDISDQASHSFYNNKLDIWLSQMRRSFQKAVMNGNLMDSLKQMEFLMMRFLTFYMKVRIITKKSTARIGKRNIQSQSASNSIIMNQYNYSKKA